MIGFTFDTLQGTDNFLHTYFPGIIGDIDHIWSD